MKKDSKISIRTDDGLKTFVGTMERTDKSVRIEYCDEGIICVIACDEKGAYIKRCGSPLYEMTLRLNESTPVAITTEYGEIPADIRTGSITVTRKNNAVKIELEYSLIFANTAADIKIKLIAVEL